MYTNFIGSFLISKVKHLAAFAGVIAITALAMSPAAAQSNAFEQGFLGGVVVGIAPGQAWRVHVPGIQPSFSDGSVRTIRGHVKVFDGSGLRVFQSQEVVIRPGTFHTFEIRRDDLAHPGDPGTRRLDVKLEVVLVSSYQTGGSSATSTGFHTNFELVDDESGKTLIALLVPAVQKVRE